MSSVSEIMSTKLVKASSSDPVTKAAQLMRDNECGTIIVQDNGTAKGLLTDRDIVTRCLAEGSDPENTSVGECCTSELVTLSPSADLEEVVQTMRDHDIRRVLITEGEEPQGIISLGDLAIRQDPNSVLGNISAAPPNN